MPEASAGLSYKTPSAGKPPGPMGFVVSFVDDSANQNSSLIVLVGINPGMCISPLDHRRWAGDDGPSRAPHLGAPLGGRWPSVRPSEATSGVRGDGEVLEAVLPPVLINGFPGLVVIQQDIPPCFPWTFWKVWVRPYVFRQTKSNIAGNW